jgi:hypothetical protein
MTAGRPVGRVARAARLVTDVVGGGAQVLGALVASPLARRRYNRWGATAREVAAAMPGDDLVPRSRLGYTRAITIRAEAEDVWPWLVQIGQGRGGLYSYDGLENLVGCRIRSAERLLPEHQRLAVGDLVRLGPEGYPCFRVHRVDPPTTLVLVGADPRPPHATPGPGSPAGIATWQWTLRPAGPGRTRVVVRQRLSYPDAQHVLWRVVEPVAFVMERRMLHGIRRRAEAGARGLATLERGDPRA